MILKRIKPDGTIDIQEETEDKARIEAYNTSVQVFNKRDKLEDVKEQWTFTVEEVEAVVKK